MAFASSGGRSVDYSGVKLPVKTLDPRMCEPGDYLLGATSSRIAAEWVEPCVEAGAVVVDNSSAFRMLDDVPLVVPEVNRRALSGHRGIIANPNCSTIQLVTAIAPILEEVDASWISVSTYQAVSGAGGRELERLRRQISQRGGSRPLYYGNVLTEIGEPEPGGYCFEELKLIHETAKILGRAIPVFPACARVAVEVGHTESVSMMLSRPLAASEALEILESAPGIALSRRGFTPVELAGSDIVGVGRVRNHPEEPRMLQFWVTADNLRKGAALNAVQILECLLEDHRP